MEAKRVYGCWNWATRKWSNRNVSSRGVRFNMHKTCASKNSQQRTSTYWDFLCLEIKRAWERLQLISYGSQKVSWWAKVGSSYAWEREIVLWNFNSVRDISKHMPWYNAKVQYERWFERCTFKWKTLNSWWTCWSWGCKAVTWSI